MVESKCEKCECSRIECVREADETLTEELICEAYCPYAKCCVCGERFDEYDDLYRGICFSCAKDAYTPRLGLLFVQSVVNKGTEYEYTLKKDFVAYMFPSDGIDTAELTDVLFDAIRAKISDELQSTRGGKYLIYLKDFCLRITDTELWIDFLRDGNYV